MSKWQIKDLLGSITYGIRLELLETIEKLETIFVRMEFYISKRKTNEIIVNTFEALIYRIWDFWQNEANLDIYPRKMATWLSDYLEWLGYPNFDYQTILNAIYFQLDRAEDQTFLSKTLEIKDADIKAKIRKIELKLPATNKDKFLLEQIDKFIEEIPTTIKTSIFYFDQDNKMYTIENKNEIIREEKSVNEYYISNTFKNPLETPLKDVMVNDTVPYQYKINKYEIIGFENVEPVKKLLDEGLQLSWIIPEVKTEQEIKIRLYIERRVSRTILMNVGDSVNIINTYFNIIPLGETFTASDDFSNVDMSVDNLIIKDQIPTVFNILEISPEDPHILDMQKTEVDQFVRRYYSSIEVGKNLKHNYILTIHEIYKLDKLLIKTEVEQDNILEIAKIIEPNIRFQEILISYYLKFNKNIKELSIKEIIPKNMNVTMHYPSSIEKFSEVIEDKVIQTWKIIPEISKNIVEFGYISSGDLIIDFPIELIIPEMNIHFKGKMTPQIEKRMFFLPELHHFLQKNKKN
ncbi:MAG: hypothetical protein ACFFCM_13415 [Promethearchaeota archaeon]